MATYCMIKDMPLPANAMVTLCSLSSALADLPAARASPTASSSRRLIRISITSLDSSTSYRVVLSRECLRQPVHTSEGSGLDQGTTTFAQRPPRVLRRNRREAFAEIVFRFRLRDRLHLPQI